MDVRKAGMGVTCGHGMLACGMDLLARVLSSIFTVRLCHVDKADMVIGFGWAGTPSKIWTPVLLTLHLLIHSTESPPSSEIRHHSYCAVILTYMASTLPLFVHYSIRKFKAHYRARYGKAQGSVNEFRAYVFSCCLAH